MQPRYLPGITTLCGKSTDNKEYTDIMYVGLSYKYAVKLPKETVNHILLTS